MTEDNKTLHEIENEVAARVAAEADAIDEDKKGDGITGAFISDCLNANERGDGALFAAIHRDRFIFDKTSSAWYRWGGHHWIRDKKEDVYTLVESVALKYIEGEEAKDFTLKIKEAKTNENFDLAEKLEKFRAAYHARIKRLRSTKGANNCLDWAHRVEDGLKICYEDFDRDPWLLACANGVIELRTGRFRSGRQTDYITKGSPHNWRGIDAPAPAWEQFLSDVFDGDQDIIGYVQRLFGYGITGLAIEHILPVLHGEGRNGKGTLVEMLRYVLGPLAQPIQSEMLLDQRSTRASSGASPDTMALKGLRIAFASETDEGRRFSTSKAKWLSGGDTLTGRNLYDKHETTFEPTHLLCLLTNHLPHANGDDFAFWQRIHLVPFKIKFVDDPKAGDERKKDKGLIDKLRSETPGILAWLIRGNLDWQRQGLNPPAKVLSATEEYRFNEDDLAVFIESCCYPLSETSPDTRTKYSEIYDSFVAWYLKTCGDKPLKKKKFGQIMDKRFKRKLAGGLTWFYGISILPEFKVVKDDEGGF